MQAKYWVRLAAAAAICSISAVADHGSNSNSKSGDDDSRNNSNSGFSSGVIGSTPGSNIGGVPSGGAPWAIREGKASVSRSGRIHVEVQGLLIAAGSGVPSNLVGTVGSVQMVAASLVCGGSGGTVVQSTTGVMLTAGGNAEIEANITLPSACAAPVVLVRNFNNAALPGAQLGSFIALSGLSSSSSSSSSQSSSSDDGPNHR